MNYLLEYLRIYINMDPELIKKFEELSLKLNPRQKDAVETIDGPVMLVAGPGSGKTQTIAMRIANILKQTQLNPENILCLTFTDSAVNTMRRRLISIIGSTAYDVKIYTFHGFCNEVIQTHPTRFGDLGDRVEPINDVDKLKLLSSLIEQLPYDSYLKPFGRTQTYIRDIQSLISGFKRDDISVEEIEKKISLNTDFYNKTAEKFKYLKSLHYKKLNNTVFTGFFVELQNLGFSSFPFLTYLMSLYHEFGNEKLTQLRNSMVDQFLNGFSETITQKQIEFVKIFKSYEQALKEEGKYDYDDMIARVVDRFESDKELLSEYQERYQYILVDEFQDTNSSQNKVLRLLGSFWSDPNIFVVGDDDQSIFRFQGASVENMAFFYNTYLSKIRVISLSENYRSHQLILDSSRAVIKNNGLQIDEMIPNIKKDLHAFHEDKVIQKIEVTEYKDSIEECNGVTEKVKELIAGGIKPKEIAVIYRDNRDSLQLTDCLKASGIKYRLEKGENVLDNKQVRKFLDLLQYLIEPEDEKKLFILLNYDYLGLNTIDLAKIYAYRIEGNKKYSQIIESVEELERAGVVNKDAFTSLASKLFEWRRGMYNNDGCAYFNALLRESGFLNFTTSKPDRIKILNKLSRAYEELKDISSKRDSYNLSEFIEDLKMYKAYNVELTDKLWGIDSEDSIRLMTAHGAKGQEFEQVFIIKCQDRKWGARANMNRLKPPFGLMQNQLISVENDEERRLFYVAMTRAKQGLYITYSRFNEKQRENNPSKFIKEIPEQYINFHEMKRNEEDIANTYTNIIESEGKIDHSEEGRNILNNILSDFKLNASNIISYRKCPRCFLYNNILRVPSLMSKSAALGSAVHHALRNMMDIYISTSALPPIEKVIEDYVSSLRYSKLPEKEFLDALRQGEKILSDYYKDRQGTFPKKAMNEVNFAHHGIVVSDIPITGKIDRIDYQDSSNTLLSVVDYKTGNPDNSSSKLRTDTLGDYFLQLVFYKILIENSHTIKGSVTEGRIEFLQRSSKGDYVTKVFSLTPDHVNAVLDLAKEVYGKIMALDFTNINTDTYNTCESPEFHQLQHIF